MPVHALAKPGPEAAAAAPPRRLDSGRPVVLAVASALLLWAAFPPLGWGWSAWVALFPFFLLIKSPGSRRSVYAGSWVGGLVFWLLAIEWVRLSDPEAWPAWIAMALALSAWWPAFLVLARFAVLRCRLPIMLAAPVLWVALEYIRAHVLTGFPWYYLAHTQHRFLPLIQIADLSGALGLSFLIALGNAWLVDLATVPLFRATPRGFRLTAPQLARLAIVGAALAATIGYGEFRIASARFHDGPRLALLQSNLIQKRKMSAEPEQILAVYQALVGQALSSKQPLDLIVWPETAYPSAYIIRDPKLSQGDYERQVRGFDSRHDGAFWADWQRQVSDYLHRWTDQIGVPMLVGVLNYDFGLGGFAKYNTAILFEPQVATVQRYAKIHLVPFGEYVPLIDYLPWLTVLTPYHRGHVPNLSYGREAKLFTLGRYRFATAICFEDTIPQAVRRFFRQDQGGGQPDVLVNISNDGWFQGSSEHDMHLAISIFRAVENRVPLARAANTGLSALIDGNGRVLVFLEKLTEGVLFGTVPLDDRSSVYSAWGDWLGRLCLALTLALLGLAIVRPSRLRQTA